MNSSPSIAVLAPKILATGNAPLLASAASRCGLKAEVLDVNGVQAQPEAGTLLTDSGRTIEPDVIVVTDIPNTEYGKLLVVDDLCRMPTAPFVRSSSTWAMASNKNDVSERLAQAGLPIPQSIRVTSGDDGELFDAFARLGGESGKFVWVKDPLGSGGTGVKPVKGIGQLLEASRQLRFHQGIELQLQADVAGVDDLGFSYDFCVAILGPDVKPYTYMRRERSPSHGVTSTSHGGTKQWVPTPPGFEDLARSSLTAVGLETGFVDISTPTRYDTRILEIGIDGNLNGFSFLDQTVYPGPDLPLLAIGAALSEASIRMQQSLQPSGLRNGLAR